MIGYMTMTGDLLHFGHIELLKKCKQLCDTLIIGLTTDTLAVKQKRKPIFDYNHRKCVLESCKYVDIVVEHDGASKEVAYKKLKFDILFTGDDYFMSSEYSIFENKYPDIKVVYLPRTSGISSTIIIQQLENKLISNMSFFKKGIGGNLFTFNCDKNRKIILKPVKLGIQESFAWEGEDVYKIAYPNLPRNWKKDGQDHKYPMISGVNGFRELLILNYIKGKRWSPFESYHLAYENNSQKVVNEQTIANMQLERENPSRIYLIRMKYAGKTLGDYMNNLENMNITQKLEKMKHIFNIVEDLILEMTEMRIVHGDVHLHNVCIDEKGIISFIDFGWCMHHSFVMSDEENAYYNQCITEEFDLQHFRDSIKWWEQETRSLEEQEQKCALLPK